jgi:hypothetical protein
MYKIVASMSLNSVGCTFLDWSILYLSGQDQFYSFNSKKYEILTSDPVTDNNAHGHKKNHALGSANNQQHIEEFLNNHSGLLTLYPAMSSMTQAAEHYSIDPISVEFAIGIGNQFKDYVFDDFKNLWHYLDNKKAKIIWIADDPNLLLTHLTKRSSDTNLKGTGPTSFQELDQEFQELFYQDSIQTWQSLGLTDIWDERERRALDLRPHTYTMSDPVRESTIPFDLPHLHITTAEWWTQGEFVMRRVMQFCDLDIDQSRWDNWKDTYRRWASNMEKQLSFCYRLPSMLNAILNNWYYDLGELSFVQEVAIQHYLIYKHNLNIKTWQLSKFPRNAQDLHKLLEPNTHSVPNIYNS